MSTDKKKLYIISSSILAALLLTLFAPMGSGRIIAAVLLLPSAIITSLLIKKRIATSIHSKQVLLIISVIGLLYFSFYYFSAIYFGFVKTGYGINKPDILLEYIIPVGVIIVSTEMIRYVLCSQKRKGALVMAYLISLCSEILICATIPSITNMATFMDVVGLTLFPGILCNLLYNYLTSRYGPWPIVILKALTVWAFYLIPYGSAISNTLLGFVDLLLPIAIYLFIDSLYEKKRKFALGNTSRFLRIASRVLTVIVLILMVGTMMLVSNHFKYGSLVIATESMTGELNKGDVIIFEGYDGETVEEGQVIVFEKNRSMIVHRIVEIEIVNGTTYYYTKGDANEDRDAGFITDSNIVGTVNYKLPALGYPTLWIRSLFKR